MQLKNFDFEYFEGFNLEKQRGFLIKSSERKYV